MATDTSKEFEKQIGASLAKLQVVIPSSSAITPEKMARLALMEVINTPKLRECLPDTIVTSVVQAAALGLHVGRMLGEAYLVPYWNKKMNGYTCQLIPGYKGLVRLAIQGLAITDISSRLVYEGDEWDVQYGTNEYIRHKPALDAERLDDHIIHGYTIAKVRGEDRVTFEWMTRAEVDKRRGKSQQADSGPWVDWYPEQFKKTCIRNGVRALPASGDSDAFQRLQAAVELDNRFDSPEVFNGNDILDSSASMSDRMATRTASRIDELKAERAARTLGAGAMQPVEVKQGEKVEAQR